jgi:ring-1,2-phenylacetyl-CoA epoxidase subunit PaaD
MEVPVSTIYEWLDEVKDPEIPVLSLTDMGIIREIIPGDNSTTVIITPTFVGCPALDLMKSEIIEKLQSKGIAEVDVQVSFKHAWTSDDITEKGRHALKKFGLAPPPQGTLYTDLDILEYAKCPRCDGRNTELKSPFGPTLCRSIHYCNDCREAFEQFKPV